MKNWMVGYAIVLHCVWGILLLGWSSPQNVTAIAAISQVIGGNHRLEGMLLIGVAGLALFSLARGGRDWGGILLLLPQQFVLSLSAIGAMLAIAAGQFADGVPRPVEFILADQFPAVLAAVMHTAAILDHYGLLSKRRWWN